MPSRVNVKPQIKNEKPVRNANGKPTEDCSGPCPPSCKPPLKQVGSPRDNECQIYFEVEGGPSPCASDPETTGYNINCRPILDCCRCQVPSNTTDPAEWVDPDGNCPDGEIVCEPYTGADSITTDEDDDGKQRP